MDSTPLETDLLHHRDFLLRLATSLVGRNDAEDLVQDVWTRALEHGRPDAPGERSWLARVARNLAVSRFRARGQREQLERSTARPEAEGSALGELDERFELGQAVASAVRELDEPQRVVILLRYFEGLAQAEIAARLGLPIATVRTRQQRALASLRERLDRRPGGREAWSVALGSWIATRGGAGASAGPLVLVGALAGAALVLAAGWFVFGPSRGDEGTPPSPEVARSPASSASAARATDLVAGEPGAARQTPAPEARAPRTLLSGRIEGLSRAELLETVVRVDAEWKRYAIDSPPVPTQPDEDGRFEVEVAALLAYAREPADELVVTLDHPLHLQATARVATSAGILDAQGDTRFDAGALVGRDAAVLRGDVRLPDGSPAAGAEVEALFLDGGEPRKDSSAHALCDATGRYDLRLERGGECAIAQWVDGVRPGTVVAAARLGSALELGTSTLETGLALAGEVTRLGQAMPLAQVYVQGVTGGRDVQRSGGSRAHWVGGRFEWSLQRIEADSAGRFATGGLAAGDYDLSVLGAARMSCLSMHLEDQRVTAPSTDLALEFRASLVTLERSAGSPGEVTGKIRVSRNGIEEAAFWLYRASDQPRTTFVAPPNVPLSLSIELEGLPAIPLEITTPGPGEELRRVIAFEAPGALATLELEWAGDPRLALDALRVYFESPDGQARFDRGFYASNAADGVFRMSDVPPGRHRVRVHAGWDHGEFTPALDRILELELAPGETRREPLAFELGGLLRVDVRAASGERCAARFRLLDARGEPVPVPFRARRDDTTLQETWLFQPWSEHESETLPAGDYELVLWDDGLAEQRLPVRLTAGETTALVATMQPE